MATYKVLQDIEAEDKFVGPLTLKQFILAGIAALSAYLSFFLLTKGLWILVIPLVPVFLFSGFLAFPWGRDQPTEVWLLAKIRFALVPRRRIWDQTGIQELVTITAPKHVESYVSDNLSQTEVKSRLKALADTIDSRGWAVKNAAVNMYTPPSFGQNVQSTDRLVEASAIAREVPPVDIGAADDIMDEQNNPTAQHLNQMINDSSQAHRQATLETIQHAREEKPTKKPSKSKASFMPSFDLPFAKPDTKSLTKEEQEFLDRAHHKNTQSAYGHTKVIPTLNDKIAHRPKHKKVASKPTVNREQQTSLKETDPAILGYANNDDLTVATIARQINKKPENSASDGEVVVPLR